LFINCGGGGSSNNVGNSDYIADYLSNIPTLNATGHAIISDYKDLIYHDNSSAALARSVNATISGRNFTLDYGYCTSVDEFSLNDPVSNLNSAIIYIDGVVDPYGSESYIDMSLYAENRSIKTSEFVDIFGEIDANLLEYADIRTEYEGDMSAKFTEYYASVTASGGFFDINDSSVYCNTDGFFWSCEKDDGEARYYFYFETTSGNSFVEFNKYSW
jgi:hypothetical protein